MRTLTAVAMVLLLAGLAGARGKLPPPSRLSLVQAHCGRCACQADADCGADGTCAGGVCTAGDVGRVSCAAETDCAAGMSCAPIPHPCSAAFSLAGGTATVRSAREPAPTCPRTQKTTEVKSGDVRLVGVTRDGASFTGPLDVGVMLKVTFGTDPNGSCPFAAVQIPFEGLTATLDCRAGKCRGTLYPFACLPKECADTPITSELIRFVVREPTGAALATPGIFLVPAAADAP